ncbi:Maf family protein [Candidatus Dependentiae bacterium]|nr:Maf family protein [Candidatus Dependentiae bacterium]
MHKLLLASKSSSRKDLLTQAEIPFVIVEQNADETVCDWGLPLGKLVESIATHKMKSVILPEDDAQEGDVCFVLTADTLGQDSQGNIHGKPKDKDDAIQMISRARNGMRTATGFCLERRVRRGNNWELDKRVLKSVETRYIFDVPDDWIEKYFEHSIGLKASGAIAIEYYGLQFLKIIDGSYSAVMGFPMFELREALTELGFFRKMQKKAPA